MYKHLYKNVSYGHFSAIDEYDCNLFPNLSYANPLKFILEKNQALYIPKKWWHWVKNTQKTFAVNYWFDNKIGQQPFVFDHVINFCPTSLNNDIVRIWKSEKTAIPVKNRSFTTSFHRFYNSKKDHQCLITAENYEMGAENKHIKNKLRDFIKFPIHEKIICTNSYDFNIWVSSNFHDTGLHYDDEDGILTVIEGQKEITLFPPSDTIYLYPYQIDYEWRGNPALNFKYNTFQKSGPVKGVSSGELLYVTCNKNTHVLSNISKLYYKFNETNLIWGFKKFGNEYRWEIYNYTLNNRILITSWDIYSNEYNISDEEHYYFKLYNTSVQLPFWGYGKFKKNNILYNENTIFVVDSYDQFYKKYDVYMDKLGYNSIKTKFKNIILEKYLNCYEISIHNKKPKQIFVQYMGLTNKEFLDFLKENNYPEYIINFVEEKINGNDYHINNEITIVYDTVTQSIIRSGFYGHL
jgi:hypothetical protein